MFINYRFIGVRANYSSISGVCLRVVTSTIVKSPPPPNCLPEWEARFLAKVGNCEFVSISAKHVGSSRI